MVSDLEIGVIGTGPIGCYLGGRLLAAGADVVFVGRTRAKLELEEAGLSLADLRGQTVHVAKDRIAFETDAARLRGSGLVLCCVKSAQTAEVAEQLAAVLSPDAIVVSMQNGLRNRGVLRERLKTQTSLGAIVGFNVVPKGAGSFRQTTAGSVIVEASPDPRVEHLVRALSRGGVETEVVDDIRAHQWAKLIMNLNNAVSALSGAPSRDLVFVPGYRSIVAAVVTEALAVMRAAKVRPARLRGIPAHLFPILLRLPTPLVKIVARSQLRIDPEARSSMWEDLSRGRATEVDDLNGEIVRLAASCGAPAPLNGRLVELVHEVERAGAGSPKLTPEAFRAALGI